MAAMKRCPRCKTEKSIEAFNQNAKRADGLSNWCRSCTSAYLRDWRAERKGARS